MNEFYCISKEETQEDRFQLKNLGAQRVSGIIGKSSRDGWGGRTHSSQKFYVQVKAEDYDDQFADKIKTFSPPYDIELLLNYHLEEYLIQSKGLKDKFLKHIKYVVIPRIKKRKDSSVQVELVENWLQENMEMKKKEDFSINVGDINSPTQIQINSDGSNQTQEIQYSKEDVYELFEALKKDALNLLDDQRDELLLEIQNAEKRLKKGKDIKSRLHDIGELIQETGIKKFMNLAMSSAFELMKTPLGLE